MSILVLHFHCAETGSENVCGQETKAALRRAVPFWSFSVGILANPSLGCLCKCSHKVTQIYWLGRNYMDALVENSRRMSWGMDNITERDEFIVKLGIKKVGNWIIHAVGVRLMDACWCCIPIEYDLIWMRYRSSGTQYCGKDPMAFVWSQARGQTHVTTGVASVKTGMWRLTWSFAPVRRFFSTDHFAWLG